MLDTEVVDVRVYALMLFEKRYVQPDDAIARVFEDGAVVTDCRKCGALLFLPVGLEPECLESCVPELRGREDVG